MEFGQEYISLLLIIDLIKKANINATLIEVSLWPNQQILANAHRLSYHSHIFFVLNGFG